ncbi:MAG: UDP-N-acetylmuramoyl-L-alanine--D-glutamate ligase, partial [Bdellovibrionales bacterium]|nr:UDP-N-acetylmuramoyl-L-alanine--D-glutamate ligase [Bdellovibrionales bacterium]
MLELSDLKDRRILIVGLARTGVALSKFLSKNGAKVTVSDHKSKAELANFLEQMEGLNVTLELGGHTPKTFLNQDLIVLSPGVPPHLKLFDYARSQGVKVTGEFEFCSQFVKEPVIALTGTNGKTTVSHLVELFLRESGVNVWIGGNYGAPLSEYLAEGSKADVLICEVSSFMLEHVETFTPKNIVFTNLAENHLDRYRSMEEYINAKRKIFLNTNQGTTSILNADDNAVVELARDPAVQRGRIFYFSRKPSLEPQIMNIGGAVAIKDQVRVRTGPEIEYYSLANMKMKGNHSSENMMAAILAAREHGAKHEAIQRVIDSFNGMPHRLEYVRRVGGVQFFNDSKATNVHAVSRALDVFEENVILI